MAMKKKTPEILDRQFVTDYVKISFRYRDIETGRFVNAEKAKEIPGRVKKEVVTILIKRHPKLKAKKGKVLSRKEYLKLSNEVRKHNMAVTIALKQGISYREARKRVERAVKMYKKGLISPITFKREIGS
jgi:hypothetical protein